MLARIVSSANYEHLVGLRLSSSLVTTGLLGAGAMGVVLRARHDGLRRDVAVKFLNPGLVSDDPEALERFLQEARVIARLRHPGLVSLLDAGRFGPNAWFSMELIEGRSLAEALEELAPPAALSALADVADALAYVHREGFVHRDLKPQNVMLRSDGRAVLMDFGLVKDLEAAGLTAAGALLGTPAYMPPEQASGEEEVGPAADIYALGAILYTWLAGRPPYRAPNALNVLFQVLKGPPPAPSEIRDGVPPELEALCLKAMARDPRARFADAHELAQALRAAAGPAPRTGPGRCVLRHPELGDFVLRPGGELTVGREAGRDVRIPSGSVSRLHARLVWGAEPGARPAVVDEGSANGTTVDGELVSGRALLPVSGRVSFAGHEFSVLLEEGEGRALLDEETSRDVVVGAFSLGQRLSGRLVDAFSIHEVLRKAEDAQLTGTLDLTTPRGEAAVTLGMGRIMAVRAPALEGLEALDWVLSAQSGRYRFRPELEPCESTLDLSFARYARGQAAARRKAAARRREEERRAAAPPRPIDPLAVPPRAPTGAPPAEPAHAPAGATASATARPASVRPTGEPAAWLDCPPFDPVPVRGELRVGRDPDCALVLPHVAVSFLHALVRDGPEGLEVEDRSLGGTYLNGERVLLSALRPGDTLTVGPYAVRVEARRPRTRTRPPVQPLELPAQSATPGGRLARVPLPRLLRLLAGRSATGLLEFTTPAAAGELALLRGRVVHARKGDLRGEEAARALLSADKGRFLYHAKRRPPEQSLDLAVEALLDG
ncbi:MAG: FHA domain-containing protein [Planctomycetota bacterium]|nr:MAG: FHA domain-containing protein [Planctomycetota bacterium]